MRKGKLIVFITALMAGVSFEQDANLLKYVNLLPPNCSTNLSVTGTTTDIANYKGNACLVVQTGTASATNNTITVTLQHSSASNFANPATVTNLMGTAGVLTEFASDAGESSTVNIQYFSIDTARLKKYVRVIYTTTLADNYIPVSAVLVCPMKAE